MTGPLPETCRETVPFIPPHLPQRLARLLTRLSRRVIDIPLLLGDRTFRLCPNLAGTDTGPGKGGYPRGGIRITLDVAGEPWLVRICGPVAEALPATLTDLHPEDIPGELRPALWALMLEALLDRASAALGEKAVLTDVTTARDAEETGPEHPAGDRERWRLPFAVYNDTGGPAGSGFLLMPLSAGALSLSATAGNAFPRRLAGDTASLPLALSLCAGHEYFPLGLLREARPGDVLQFSLPAAPKLTLEVNTRALWTATLADGVVTLKGVLSRPDVKDVFMFPAPSDTGAASSGNPEAPASERGTEPGLSAAEVNALEVRLTLELDERLITVGELAALAPGHILETGVSPDAPVMLKVNGRAVGRGRLVEVGDRLGVMIVSLSLSASDAGQGNRE
ncbi:MAG: type III secretion system cytoplasmic ring protein SctQ [Desulfovibrio sp.]|jgi:type III secretion protein Q|nr:type III secretion system cytoplasmic ring protein SctQ [Desulfovibrio sp.]